MNELLNLLNSLLNSLVLEMKTIEELLPVLDEEEEMLSSFKISSLEKTVFEKDLIVKQIKALEKKRVHELNRICFLIGFDCRLGLPTLSEMNIIFKSYFENVKNLIDAEMQSKLGSVFLNFETLSKVFIEFFSKSALRIQRNQKIMLRLSENMSRSVKILSERHSLTQSYDAQGKTLTQGLPKLSLSSLKIKA
jgi:flagellar biosynthesis/type III secretory pathway chaperone